MKLREALGEQRSKELHQRVDGVLDSEGAGFIIIVDHMNHQISDVYQGVCDYCVDMLLHTTMHSAVHAGTLPEKAFAMLMGHKHEGEPQNPHMSLPEN